MFLTIVTRCCQRPKMLSENIASVKAQTCHDLEQIFIVDRQRKGIHVADKALVACHPRVIGDYVYILDDDCMLIDDGFVEAAKEVVESEAPALIMVKSRRPPGKPSMRPLVPLREVWQGKLRHGSTNCLCYVMRADLWKKHISAFARKAWGGDWWFLKEVLDEEQPSMFWLDRIVADARQLGRGRIFEDSTKGWFERVAKRHGLVNVGRDDWRLRLWMHN